MTRAQFIEKARAYGYDEKGIEELLAIYEEMVEIMPDASYEDIVLIPQPEY